MKTDTSDQPSPDFGTAGMWPAFAQKLPPSPRLWRTSRRGKQVAPSSLRFDATSGDRMKGAPRRQIRNPQSAIRNCSAFTLVELLTVLGIIGVIAGFVLMVAGPVKKKQYIYNTQTEMAQLETAIERYHAAYGFYPPDGRLAPAIPGQPQVNQLYYELTGTTNLNSDSSTPPIYQSLNDPSRPTLTGGVGGDVEKSFGVDGFVNCSKPGGSEDSAAARNFLPDLKPNQVWYPFTNGTAKVGVVLLVTSVRGPDQIYKPLGVQDLNLWRYNSSSPTNNPGSYDLWVQLGIGGKTNLICNWTKEVQLNSPWP